MFTSSMIRTTNTNCRSMAKMLPRRPTTTTTTNVVQKRDLSSQTTIAIEKLKNAFEEYRKIHYTQEIPSRFKKDLVKAATKGTNTPDIIAIDGLQRLLYNIGATQRVSLYDIETIFNELGDTNGTIPAHTMIQII